MIEVDKRGGPMTFTVKLHQKDRWRASEIVQATVVVPTENALPEAGEQLTVSGWTLPAACGSSKVTRTGWPAAEVVTTGAGHAAVAFGDALRSLGSVDDPCVQPAANNATTTQTGAPILLSKLSSIPAVELCILRTRAPIRAKRGEIGLRSPGGHDVWEEIGRKAF